MQFARLVFMLSIWVMSCQRQEVTPPVFAGNWMLVQKQVSRDYSSHVQATFVSETIPASPKQTISFVNPSQFNTTITQDTLFNKARYFFVGSNYGVVGPRIYLGPDASASYEQKTESSFGYALYQDSLLLQTVSGRDILHYKFLRTD